MLTQEIPYIINPEVMIPAELHEEPKREPKINEMMCNLCNNNYYSIMKPEKFNTSIV